jgi:hypothetical protein
MGITSSKMKMKLSSLKRIIWVQMVNIYYIKDDIGLGKIPSKEHYYPLGNRDA